MKKGSNGIAWFFTVLFIGFNNAVTSNEAYDLAFGQPALCSTIPNDYQNRLYGTVGTFINGAPLICGGYDTTYWERSSRCLKYENDSWMEAGQLRQERKHAAATMLYNGSWVVTGGVDNEDDLDTIEVYTPGQGFTVSDITLPEKTSGHNILTLNETHLFLIDGSYTYILDMESGNWTEMARSSNSFWYSFAGVIVRSNGEKEVVVAVGQHTEIFSLKSNSWRDSTPLPNRSTNYGSSVQYGNTFLAVGGSGSNAVYMFNPEDDKWEHLLSTQAEEQNGINPCMCISIPCTF